MARRINLHASGVGASELASVSDSEMLVIRLGLGVVRVDSSYTHSSESSYIFRVQSRRRRGELRLQLELLASI